eukprot:m.28436 g.28436  ORF g.28436 m.28436 type:complete len:69 (+) comp30779_c0_seq2:91-297(+)
MAKKKAAITRRDKYGWRKAANHRVSDIIQSPLNRLDLVDGANNGECSIAKKAVLYEEEAHAGLGSLIN